MTDLAAKLRGLDPEKETNASLHDWLEAIVGGNQQLSEQILVLLDRQDELAAHYARVTAALLQRQGQKVTPTAPADNLLDEVLLRDAWNV